MAGASREAVIDFEFLRGRNNETVVNELYVASATASETFRFKSPYKMAVYGSSKNGIGWSDGHIEYKNFHTVFTEALASFAHLYDYGISKVTFLYTLTCRSIHNLEDVDCPTPSCLQSQTLVTCHATNYQICLSTKTALPFMIG
jgi:hypothetical protein